MTYRLSYDPGVEAMHDALTPAARKFLSEALAAACDDPIGATAPYGVPEARMRMVNTPYTYALVFISYSDKSLAVLEIGPEQAR